MHYRVNSKRSHLFIFLIIFLLTAILGGGRAKTVHAANESTSAAGKSTVTLTPTTDKAKQIEDLKERLATKVAQLRQTQPRAVTGIVKSITVSTATIETDTKDLKLELTDDIKVIQYLKGVRTKLSLDSLAKGDRVVIFGEYDTTLDLWQAKLILIYTQTGERVSGTITNVDKVGYTLTLATSEKREYVIDIEKNSKTNSWDKVNGITKSGFSKLTVGDTIHVLGVAVPKKENRLSAVRILDLGNLTGAPTPLPTATETPKISPTAPAKSTP